MPGHKDGRKTSASSIQTLEPISGQLFGGFVLQSQQVVVIRIWRKHKCDTGPELLSGNKDSWFCETMKTDSTHKLQCFGIAKVQGECHQSLSIATTKYTSVYQPYWRDGLSSWQITTSVKLP
jgi:hypothetical protein